MLKINACRLIMHCFTPYLVIIILFKSNDVYFGFLISILRFNFRFWASFCFVKLQFSRNIGWLSDFLTWQDWLSPHGQWWKYMSSFYMTANILWSYYGMTLLSLLSVCRHNFCAIILALVDKSFKQEATRCKNGCFGFLYNTWRVYWSSDFDEENLSQLEAHLSLYRSPDYSYTVCDQCSMKSRF